MDASERNRSICKGGSVEKINCQEICREHLEVFRDKIQFKVEVQGNNKLFVNWTKIRRYSSALGSQKTRVSTLLNQYAEKKKKKKIDLRILVFSSFPALRLEKGKLWSLNWYITQASSYKDEKQDIFQSNPFSNTITRFGMICLKSIWLPTLFKPVNILFKLEYMIQGGQHNWIQQYFR